MKPIDRIREYETSRTIPCEFLVSKVISNSWEIVYRCNKNFVVSDGDSPCLLDDWQACPYNRYDPKPFCGV